EGLCPRAEGDRRRLHPAPPPPHRRNGMGDRSGGTHADRAPVHPASRAHDTRIARDLSCASFPQWSVDGVVARGAPRVLRRCAVRHGARRASVDEGDARVELGPPHCPLRRAHWVGRGVVCARQPRKGGGRAGDPVRQPRPRAARDHWPPRRRDHAVSVTTPTGFEAGGIACGLKATGGPDLALVATADRRPVPAAAVFTTNRVQAAPVQVSREHLADGRAAAVVLNSGNANAATGEAGRRAGRRMCELTADSLGCSPQGVLGCSTGLSGGPVPMEAVEAGIPKLAASLGPRGDLAAEAILTTDTRAKEFAAAVELGDGTVGRVGAMAKGAAMLAPAMATMLAVLTTDLA